MLLNICLQEVNETSFTVWNTVSQQVYTEAGIDMTTVTTATLYFGRVNGETADEVSVDIGDLFQYLFTDGGLTIDFEDFGEDLINGYAYFPDGLYTVRIVYTYDGNSYSASATVAFMKLIKNIVYQQMMKANWKKELSCSCGCDPYNTTLRKWEYLYNLQIAAELCLISEFDYTLKALYKLTGNTYEFE